MRTIFNLTERPLPGARQPESWTGMKTRLEHWRPVPIEEKKDLYEISDIGRVRSKPRMTKTGIRGGKILKPWLCNSGYLMVGLYDNTGRQKFLVHRLVAEAFIPNPDNLPCVNHKDENKLNNSVANLEFCTQKYNLNYGTARQRHAQKLSHPIIQKTENGQFVKLWASSREIERHTGWLHSPILDCCRGKRPTYKGFCWEFVN